MQLNAVFVAITGVPGSTRMCAYMQHQSSSNSSSISGVLLLLYVRVMPLAVLLCHSVYCLLYVHEYGLLLFVALVLTTGLPLYDDRSFFLWHVSWRHPAGNTPLREEDPCTTMYEKDVSCTSKFLALPPGGLFSRSRLRGKQEAAVNPAAQV